jgi:Transposase
MKKISTVAIERIGIFKENQLTIGLDLGDRTSHYCILNEAGEVIFEHELPTTPRGIEEVFGRIPRSRVALETGTHSPWVSRQLTQLGHEVIVAHARNVRLIGESSRKDDQLDARTLARLARIDPGLLGSVRHRSAKAQIHLTVIRARVALVSSRTALVNARVDEVVRPATAEMWHGANESGERQRSESGIAGCFGPAAERNRIAQRANCGIRRADRENRQGSLSSGGCAQTGERSRTADCVDLRSDFG